MPNGAPPNPQPNPDDPWLEGLTFEQISQLVMEINPDVFYQRALAFDQSGWRFQDVLDLIRHEMNSVREAWTGTAAEDFDSVVRELTGKIGNVLQFLQNPGYGAILRDAGDRLAAHQQRFRDLQGQKAAQEATPPPPGAPSPEETTKVNNDSAKQILRDLRTVYWEVGNALAPLPYKPPDVTVGTNNQNDGNGNGHGHGSSHGGGNGSHGDGNGGSHGDRNGDGQSNGHGQSNGNGNGNGAGYSGETYNFGPGTVFGLTALAKTETDRPGDSGGGESLLFSGQDRNVLGRVDPGGQGHDMPGTPGAVFASAPGPHTGYGVLGQGRDTVDAPGLFASGVQGPLVEDIVIPGVLGRSAGGGVTARTTDKDREKIRKAAGKPVPKPESALAETVDTTTERETIKTAVDVSATPEPETAQEIAAQATATTTSGAHSIVSPQATHEVATGATISGKPAAHAVTFSVASGSGSGGDSGGVHQVLNPEPESRGMFAPGTATTDGLAGQGPAETANGAGPAQAARGLTPDPYAPGHMSGMPMGMMGGMGGAGGNQQNGRMAAMPNEPRPEVWDPVTGAPIPVVGRRAPEPEEKPGEQLSQAEIQATLAEKFAELDRLTERGK